MKRLLSLVLCALLLVSLVVPVYAETDPTEATDATETTAAATDGATEASADAADDAVIELFNRLMSATTYEELDEMMENMTEEEYELLDQFSDEQNAALYAKKEELSENSTNVLANADVTVEQGGTATYRYNQNGSFQVVDSNGKVVNTITVTISRGNATIKASEDAAVGVYTVQYQRNNNNNWQNAFTVEVVASSSGGGSGDSGDTDTIKVYVYVASRDSYGNSWLNNTEFQDLIGLYVADAEGTDGYFPAGVIELDASYLNGKDTSTPGAALINSTADWEKLLAALHEIDTTTVNGTTNAAYSSHESGEKDFKYNQNNKVGEYLQQASGDVGYGWGSDRTAFFRWHLDNDYHNGFGEDPEVKYHLDLCFNTNKITFITGNNGIKSGDAKDGTTVDTRVYITGSLIQEPRNLNIPDGYKFAGYYTDKDFTTPWNGIGTPLNEDQVVYIKITEEDNVVLYYKNVSGDAAGSLSSYSEGLNPVTGIAVGSTATAKSGYEFAGWYSDETCTDLLSTDAKFVPTKKESERWVDGTTYYAKFEEKKATINYVVVGPDGCGTVDLNDEGTTGPATKTFETVNIATGTAVGATAEPSSNAYKFVGWYVNEDCTGNAISTEASYVPSKPSDSNWPETSTYYAKFESNVGSLTINKTVDGVAKNYIPAELAFTFTVSGPNGYEEKVTLNAANGWTYTVSNLTVGDYTVVETKVDIANYKLTTVTANDTDVTDNASTTVSVTGGSTTEVNFVNTYALDIADLTIEKIGGAGELFEFSVVCVDRGINMTVCVPGNSSITLQDLPLGTYTVTEDTSWSYRYTCAPASDSVTIEANTTKTLTFKNTLTNDKWLGGESFARNIFTGSTGTAG